MKKPVIGAYVATKSLRAWDENDETHFFENLRARKNIGGLEHGFYGSLHRYDTKWFLKNISLDWNFVFTCLPGLADRLKENPKFGLASNDSEARLAALGFIRSAEKALRQLNDHLGRKAVTAVQIHSAPANEASKENLLRSLETISSWNWDNASITIEHCDAKRPTHPHAKGFLELEEEIWAVQKLASPQFGLGLNWGRSVIEGHSTTIILDHIDQVQEAGLLKGFIFSGVANDKNSLYGAFMDKHAPAPTPYQSEVLAKESLMTKVEIQKTIAKLNLNNLNYWGIKIMPLPHPENSETSLVYIDYLFELLEQGKKIKS